MALHRTGEELPSGSESAEFNLKTLGQVHLVETVSARRGGSRMGGSSVRVFILPGWEGRNRESVSRKAS